MNKFDLVFCPLGNLVKVDVGLSPGWGKGGRENGCWSQSVVLSVLGLGLVGLKVWLEFRKPPRWGLNKTKSLCEFFKVWVYFSHFIITFSSLFKLVIIK